MNSAAAVLRTAWPVLRRSLVLLFFLAVGWLLLDHARAIHWPLVWRSIRNVSPGVLGLATALGAASYAVISCLDLLGRRYTHHRLPARKVMRVNFICYAFNLNLGSLIGGVAFRYRLYSRLGLPRGVITRVVSFSMLTNWLGYTLIAGLAFAIWPLALPTAWGIGEVAVRAFGVLLLCVAAAYLLLCWRRPHHRWTVRGHEIEVPSARMAGLQLAMSCTHWLLLGGLVWVLLQDAVDYPTVLIVMMVAAIAGVLAHVPAGLGVMEAVFVGLLGDRVAEGDLIAALLAFRGIYYLLPLALATVSYALFEARTPRIRRGPGALPPAPVPQKPQKWYA